MVVVCPIGAIQMGGSQLGDLGWSIFLLFKKKREEQVADIRGMRFWLQS